MYLRVAGVMCEGVGRWRFKEMEITSKAYSLQPLTLQNWQSSRERLPLCSKRQACGAFERSVELMMS